MPFSTSEEFIAKAEERLGVRLPHSLRSRLLANNGGEVEVDDESWTLFPVADNSDRKRLGRSASHIVAEAANARMWTGFPSRAVGIANNGGGDFLILLPDEQDPRRLSPVLYRWDHETGLHHWLADDLSELPGFLDGAA